MYLLYKTKSSFNGLKIVATIFFHLTSALQKYFYSYLTVIFFMLTQSTSEVNASYSNNNQPTCNY